MKEAAHPVKADSGNRQAGAHRENHALALPPPAYGIDFLDAAKKMPPRQGMPGLMAKLAVGAADDPLEREADAVAERVMRMPAPASLSKAGEQIQRKCAACEAGGSLCPKCEEEGKLLRRKEGSDASTAKAEAPESVRETLQTPGHPLEPGARAFFEPRFGQDLSALRIHTDGAAAKSAQAINAKAYTYDKHIAFAAGAFDPHGDAGKRLLAHEIAHAMQQAGHVARTPENKDADKCPKDRTPGAARADPKNTKLVDDPSGSYIITGPPYKGEAADVYCDLTVQAWIVWRFGQGRLSADVAQRIRTEASDKGWRWSGSDSGKPKTPSEGCQSWAAMSMSKMNRLVALAERDKAAKGAGKLEQEGGLPSLPPPPPPGGGGGTTTGGPDGKPPELSREEAEKALDPTSVYEAGAAGANRPPFPARMEGPEIEVPNGLGSYKMILDYARVAKGDPILEIAFHMSPVRYTWELFNITEVVRAGMGKGMQKEAQRLGLNTSPFKVTILQDRRR